MIKNCPLCNNGTIYPRNIGGNHKLYCEDCGASTGLHSTLQKAMKAWNRRPAEEELVKVLKEVLGCYTEYEAFNITKASKIFKSGTIQETIKKYEGGK